jgi:hypothetical protein
MPKLSFAIEPRATARLLTSGFSWHRGGGFALVIGRLSITGAWGREAEIF